MVQKQQSRSDGLVLRVGASANSPGNALHAAKQIVSGNLPGDWDVSPMGKDSRDFTVRRPERRPNPMVTQAFDFAYRLRQLRDVEDCEVALLQSVEGPPEILSRQAAVRASSSAGAGADLSCSVSHSWVHSLCSIPAAWNLPKPKGGKSQGEGIIVGHPDTGYTDHPEINDPVRLLKSQGFNFVDNKPDPRDDLSGAFGGHGTATGSVIMSGIESPESITGVAPKCSLVPLRVTTNVVLISFSRLAEAIQYAADHNHHVLSISLGGPIYSRFLHRAVEYAVSRGVIIACAAGNVWPFVVYPARLDEVLAVAASNCSKLTWSRSASGSTVDITAPGESVWRALVNAAGFSIGTSSGTSFSTAIVAGAAALWLAHHGRDNLIARYGPSGLVRVFKELVLTHGFDRPAGWDTSNFGVGILNAAKLLAAPLPATPPAQAMSLLRATPGPRGTNQVDELLELFPDQEPARVRAGLARFLQVSERDLNTSLRDVAEEVSHLAVTDMEFRRQLCRSRPVQAARVASAPPMSPQLKRMVSRPATTKAVNSTKAKQQAASARGTARSTTSTKTPKTLKTKTRKKKP